MAYNYSATFNNALLRAYSSNPAVYGRGRRGGYGGAYGGYYNRGGITSPDFDSLNPENSGSAASGTMGGFGVRINSDANLNRLNTRYYKKRLKNESNMAQIQTIGAGVQAGVSGGLGILALGTAVRDFFSPPTSFAWLNAPQARGTQIRMPGSSRRGFSRY